MSPDDSEAATNATDKLLKKIKPGTAAAGTLRTKYHNMVGHSR